jgi:hypothetical protein
MQQTDMRVYPLDDLAIEFDHKSQNPMCRGVLWTEVDREVSHAVFGHDQWPLPVKRPFPPESGWLQTLRS